jgi:hypothetical protein
MASNAPVPGLAAQRRADDEAASGNGTTAWTIGEDRWIQLHPIIEDLYINQNKQLKEVMLIMARNHGLQGT